MLRRVAAGAPRCKLFYNDVFRVDLPPNHRFPMAKYELVRRELQRLALIITDMREGPGAAVRVHSPGPEELVAVGVG